MYVLWASLKKSHLVKKVTSIKYNWYELHGNEGTFGIVFRGFHQSEELAVKRIDLEKSDQEKHFDFHDGSKEIV